MGKNKTFTTIYAEIDKAFTAIRSECRRHTLDETKLLHKKPTTNVTEPNIAAYGRKKSEFTSAPRRNQRTNKDAANVVQKMAMKDRPRPQMSMEAISHGFCLRRNALHTREHRCSSEI